MFILLVESTYNRQRLFSSSYTTDQYLLQIIFWQSLLEMLSQDAKISIVGAGIVGCSTAYYLTQARPHMDQEARV